jgi:hypothetical protein
MTDGMHRADCARQDVRARLGRRQRLSRARTEVNDSVCAMGDHQPSQRSAIRWDTGHGDKRLTFLQPLLINVEDVPVVAPSLQPADDPRRETVFRSGWIKNVCTLLTVQNAYCRDVDVGSLQILDRGVDGLRIRQERCKLVDGSMAEFINIGQGTLGHVFPSSGRSFETL